MWMNLFSSQVYLRMREYFDNMRVLEKKNIQSYMLLHDYLVISKS